MFIDAVTPDGNTFLCGGPEMNDGVTVWQSYVFSANGKKKSKVLGTNSHTSDVVALSPNGDKFLSSVDTHQKLVVRGDSCFFEGLISHEFVVVDVATNVKTRLVEPPDKCEYRLLGWNPEGTRIAYVCTAPKTINKNVPAALRSCRSCRHRRFR